MASDEMQGEDDMDSLFEGMVLFNPSQIEPHQQDIDDDDDDDDDDSSQHRKSDVALTNSPPPPSSSCSQSQPLDENLFSDLTLNLEVPEPEPEHDLQSQSRQASRRRKRSGLRIGYGRDSLSSNDPSSIATDAAVAVAVAVTVTDESSSDSVCDSTSRSEENRIHEDEAFSEAELPVMKARIHEKLNHVSQLVMSASSARKESIRNRRKAVEKANVASLRHMELEKQLEEAIEAEDFERAEKVSENLSASEKEKQAFSNSLREADAIIDAMDFKLQQALESQIAAEEECATLLEHYATVRD